ncbi:type II toxin-antitoxin system prevent-host-death family antitoxin [Pseudomonadales bacterium]|jgi:prevent-host-death family protein|nr:type II toxin-antitoxin system prevent-host-death family antitoxin [Pseudomonadales bacterium]
MKVSISEVKANLSKYVNLAYHGERIVILKNNIPLVDIVPHQVEGKRTLGLLAGQFTVPENFLDEDDQINSVFYGDDR